MRCCAECFGDRGLRRSIIPLHSSAIGRSSYCRTGSIALVAPRVLATYFETMVDAYQRDSKGKLLVEWFRNDWSLFRHPRMDDSRAKELLERLGDELNRPVLPQSAAIDYTPSQYLCEFIKNCGYQGVIYRSSLSDGINLALFDPALARCGRVAQYHVTRVSVEVAAGV